MISRDNTRLGLEPGVLTVDYLLDRFPEHVVDQVLFSRPLEK